jgi:hypothetical protein
VERELRRKPPVLAGVDSPSDIIVGLADGIAGERVRTPYGVTVGVDNCIGNPDGVTIGAGKSSGTNSTEGGWEFAIVTPVGVPVSDWRSMPY